MPNIRQPRAGSMQYWPRKRSVRPYIRIRSWADKKAEKGLLGFAGYKTGMTHVMVTDNRKNSPTKGQDIMRPVTVVECPPLKIASVRLYKKHGYGIAVANEIVTKLDKDAGRKLRLPKKTKEAELDRIQPNEYTDIRV